MVYRTERYKSLCEHAANLIKKIDKDKDQLSPFHKNFQKKQKSIQQDESKLKNYAAALSRMQMKTTMIITVFTIFFITNLRTWYAGTLVVWLPFTPFSFLQGLTHQKGEDFYGDFTIPFFFLLTNAGLRALIRKILGFNPPKGLQQNPMWPQMPQEQPYYSQ